MRIALCAILLAGTPLLASDPALLAPIYFFHGHTVGAGNRTSGLQASLDGGTAFACLTWPELITSSVAVDGSGAHVYLACGNGVMISRDGGRSWRLTGGIALSEVQRVAIDRRDPGRAFAASAYGLFRKEPGSDRWEKAEEGGRFRYASDVLQDAAEPQQIWVGAFTGLFVSHDGGKNFEPAALQGVPVRRILQDPADPLRLLAATDGAGLQESRNGGRTFERMAGPPDTVFCLALDRSRLYCGTMEGLWRTADGGACWTRSKEGLPEGYFIYGIAIDPGVQNRVLLSGNDGLLESRDGGKSFARLGFEGALIPDLAFTRLARSERAGPSERPGKPPTYPEPPPGEEHRVQCAAFEARQAELLEHFRALPAPDSGWPGWEAAALAAKEGRADETLWRLAQDRLEVPAHSMFFSMPLMGFFLHAGKALPSKLAQRIRTVMTTNPVYRGDTENHWVMHYAALLLAAESWPETAAANWYTGQETAAIHAEAKDWLEHWARLTATEGQGEFDSPNYFFMFVTPMLLLHDFARDGEVRRLAGMMLDLLLADYLTESLRGAWVGGHSRVIGEELEKGASTRVALFHWLYAGGISRPKTPHPWALFAGLSGYSPPRQFPTLANDRTPRIQFERKRVRNVIRYGGPLNPPVYKRCLMTPVYGLGSLQGGILQPIQQHTWDATWLGSADNATLFSVHPSVSARELALFFPEEVADIEATITRQKGTYASPDKLVSASPWERVGQEGNILLALYAVPEGERFPHVDLYWPDCLAREEKQGWFFGRDGEFWLAVHPTREGSWSAGEGFRRYRCPADRTGFVVVTRPFDENGVIGSYEEFKAEILRGPVPVLEGTGRESALSYGGVRLEFARPYALPPGTLFDGPFLQARRGAGVIRIQDRTSTRTLDFNERTILEQPTPPASR